MEKFSALLAIYAGNSPVTGEFRVTAHTSQWRRALMFSLMCTWINGWVNNREAGDLSRHRADCDISNDNKMQQKLTKWQDFSAASGKYVIKMLTLSGSVILVNVGPGYGLVPNGT